MEITNSLPRDIKTFLTEYIKEKRELYKNLHSSLLLLTLRQFSSRKWEKKVRNTKKLTFPKLILNTNYFWYKGWTDSVLGLSKAILITNPEGKFEMILYQRGNKHVFNDVPKFHPLLLAILINSAGAGCTEEEKLNLIQPLSQFYYDQWNKFIDLLNHYIVNQIPQPSSNYANELIDILCRYKVFRNSFGGKGSRKQLCYERLETSKFKDTVIWGGSIFSRNADPDKKLIENFKRSLNFITHSRSGTAVQRFDFNIYMPSLDFIAEDEQKKSK